MLRNGSQTTARLLAFTMLIRFGKMIPKDQTLYPNLESIGVEGQLL